MNELPLAADTMTYTLQSSLESRFSTKIIAGKIRRHAPSWLYNILLEARFVCFRKSCNQTVSPSIRYSDGSWVTRKTTADLRDIQTYLSDQSGPLAIFQVGIGNSSLYGTVKDKAVRFVGITIVQDEIEYAYKTYPDDSASCYRVYLANKYTQSLNELGCDFDYIVDNDISSYACCRYHFEAMMNSYRTMLKPDGAILVGLRGLGYFDSGFGLTERRMKAMAARYALSLEKGGLCYFLRHIP